MDFEVFPKIIDPKTGKAFWLMVLCDYETKKGKVIVNNENELRKFYNYFKEDIWLGFNVKGYDQYILKGILLGYDPGFINDQIIENNVPGYKVIRDHYKIPLNIYELSDGTRSLKELEGFMGAKIKECSVPFDLDRPLTKEELQEVIDYCLYDVKESMEVFEYKKDDFEAHLGLIKMFDLPLSMLSRTKPQLSAIILGAERQDDRGDEFEYTIPDVIELGKYNYIREWYEDPKNKTYTIQVPKKTGKGYKTVKNQLITDIAGVEHVLGFGGIHAARSKYVDEGIILLADVSSLYPSIMINFGFLSRNVREPEKFKEIRDRRLELKAKGDNREKSLKLVINSTFGASKDEYNPLYDPLMANNVTITGQLLLVDLIDKLEPYCTLIQSNTDGILIKVEKESDIELVKSIASEWEKRTGLTLEWERYSKVIQKDVNNYILGREDGSYKSKGAYVKKLNPIDYDLPVVNKAIINYFIHDIPVEETIYKCDDLIEFQKITKVTNKYLYAIHGDKILQERINRVFADKRSDAPGIFKVKRKKVQGQLQNVPEKIALTPERVFIDNGDVRGKKVPEYLDKDWYVDLAKKRIKDFIGKNPKDT